MYGLVILREYLYERSNGVNTFDSRTYDIKKRGPIALVDTKKSKMIVLVDLIETHTIPTKEYSDWHATGKWSGMVLEVEDMTADYYAYDFK